MKPLFFILLNLSFLNLSYSQPKPYFFNIPDYPASYTAEQVAARMVDGLGFRYFWATEGLTQKDLDWSPGDQSRSSYATLEHIFGLSTMVINAVTKKPTTRSTDTKKLSFEELRTKTLDNLQQASLILHGETANLKEYHILLQSPTRTTELPFWNVINGPLADALWHVGQVVSFRRSSGNPLADGVSVLYGKKSDK